MFTYSKFISIPFPKTPWHLERFKYLGKSYCILLHGHFILHFHHPRLASSQKWSATSWKTNHKDVLLFKGQQPAGKAETIQTLKCWPKSFCLNEVIVSRFFLPPSSMATSYGENIDGLGRIEYKTILKKPN